MGRGAAPGLVKHFSCLRACVHTFVACDRARARARACVRARVGHAFSQSMYPYPLTISMDRINDRISKERHIMMENMQAAQQKRQAAAEARIASRQEERSRLESYPWGSSLVPSHGWRHGAAETATMLPPPPPRLPPPPPQTLPTEYGSSLAPRGMATNPDTASANTEDRLKHLEAAACVQLQCVRDIMASVRMDSSAVTSESYGQDTMPVEYFAGKPATPAGVGSGIPTAALRSARLMTPHEKLMPVDTSRAKKLVSDACSPRSWSRQNYATTRSKSMSVVEYNGTNPLPREEQSSSERARTRARRSSIWGMSFIAHSRHQNTSHDSGDGAATEPRAANIAFRDTLTRSRSGQQAATPQQNQRSETLRAVATVESKGDISEQANPFLALALAQAPRSWQILVEHLPTAQSSRQERSDLFNQLDANANGHLSLAEVERGLLQGHDLLHGDVELMRVLKPAMMRAFHSAKGASGAGGVSADYIERREFRLLLLYLVRFISLLALFKLIDTDGDKRIDEREFKAALPVLEPWGVRVTDPSVEFRRIDENGGGYILFEELTHWGIESSIQALRDENGTKERAACIN